MQADTPIEALGAIVTFATLGVVWNLGNVSIKKIAGGEKMQWWRLGQAVAVGAVAGGVVAVRGGEPEPGEFELATAVAVPLVDKAINAARAGVEAADAAGDGDGRLDGNEVVAGATAGLRAARGYDTRASNDTTEPEPNDQEPLPADSSEPSTDERVEEGP